MSRWITVVWHVGTLAVAGVLYFFFTLPRWSELAGELSPTAGTVLRIVTAVLLASAAAPVYLDLRRTRKPELGSPQLSLTLHAWSIAGALASGMVVLATAITEIWLDLDTAGAWLFAIYAAAAAVALLGAFAFYLSFAAETAPPLEPVKTIKLTKPEAKTEAEAEADEADEDEADDESDDESDDSESDAESKSDDSEDAPAEATAADPEEPPVSKWKPADDAEKAAAPAGNRYRLRNRRPRG